MQHKKFFLFHAMQPVGISVEQKAEQVGPKEKVLKGFLSWAFFVGRNSPNDMPHIICAYFRQLKCFCFLTFKVDIADFNNWERPWFSETAP